MIKFKRGAFESLKAVKPVVLRYENPKWGMKPETDMLGFGVLLLCSNICGSVKVSHDQLPVFKPNDFFWANHWQEGKEEKWEAYARVMREIIAQEAGCGLSDLKMEDKFKAK